MAQSESCSTRQVVLASASNTFFGSFPSKYAFLSSTLPFPSQPFNTPLIIIPFPPNGPYHARTFISTQNTNSPIQPRPHNRPQVQFAQTNKAFLLQSERYQPFPTLTTTPCAKNNGFSWLKRKGTTKKALPKKKLVRQGRGWH